VNDYYFVLPVEGDSVVGYWKFVFNQTPTNKSIEEGQGSEFEGNTVLIRRLSLQ